jgi:negative regulator of sigma E activity
MSKDFEDRLRSALRPVDPQEGFEQRLLARIEREPAPERKLPRKFQWLPAAIAASAVLAVALGTHQWQARREQQGLEARQQLIEALRMTGEKLDVAYQAVNRESRPTPPDGSGA